MRVSREITSLFIAIATLTAVGCSEVGDELSPASSEGVVRINMTTSNALTSTEQSTLLDNSILRITNSEGGLIRRYSPATTAPDELELVNGKYTATLWAGEQMSSTWSKDECYYWGETNFEVDGVSSSVVSITADIVNTAVEVVFDPTIAVSFAEGSYSVTTVVADAYSSEEFNATDAITLTYSADKSGEYGYFLMPSGDGASKNIAWQFSGELLDIDGISTGTKLTQSGVISAPKSGELSRLTFKYSYDMGLSFGLSVDTSTEDHDDWFDFLLQPTVSLVGHTSSDVVRDQGQDVEFSITSLIAIETVVASNGTESITLYGDGASASGDYSCVFSNEDKEAEVKLKSSIFSDMIGGTNTITLTATGVNDSKGSDTATLYCTGMIGYDSDYWAMSSQLKGIITEELTGSETIEIKYRSVDDTAWTTLPATIGDSNEYGTLYTAQATATWSSEMTNKGGYTYYMPLTGMRAGQEYEWAIVVNGVAKGLSSFVNDDDDVTPQIPYADFSLSSLYCFSNSESGTDWNSGNNSNTPSLCTQGSIANNSCVYMAGGTSASNLTAGNLFLGTFSLSSLTGTVSFGQSFNWVARPRKFKFKYAAILGSVDETNSTSVPSLTSGSTDIGRVYLAIVDWSSRHETASTATVYGIGSTSTSGEWDPETDLSQLASGNKVIGYASLFVESGTTGVVSSTPSSLTEMELDIHYYDTETKPSGNYTIVVSCATSAYGHFFAGSSSSKMWIDDFELVY